MYLDWGGGKTGQVNIYVGVQNILPTAQPAPWGIFFFEKREFITVLTK